VKYVFAFGAFKIEATSIPLSVALRKIEERRACAYSR
jgi:hypothetical protein